MKLEKIEEIIEGMDSSKLIELNNQYCQDNRYEDEVYDNNDEFFEMFFANSVVGAVRAAIRGGYEYSETYVKFDGQGNIFSFDTFSVRDLPNNVYRISAYVKDNWSKYKHLFR